VNRYVEFCRSTLNTLWCGRFDVATYQTLRTGKNHRSRNGVDGRQREDRTVVIIEGWLVLAMMVQHAVRWHVAMYYDLGMSMVFALVDVLGRGHRQEADSQAEYARDDSGQAHR
jgi:hypothetical protein